MLWLPPPLAVLEPEEVPLREGEALEDTDTLPP